MREKGQKIISVNKKARQLYEVVETYEAGMVLLGTEVKSMRDGRVNIKDSYAQIRDAEVFLLKCHISPYAQAYFGNHEPERERKLLLKKQEIKKLVGKVVEKGFTLIPMKIYFKNGLAKVEIALAKGKKVYDRRKEIQDRDMKRDVERSLKERYR
ncbi:MAG: SsrA-binding protein [Candidatus Schekmanbacteria bacterium RBG_13_48_7]|uniref:SsrA-binding protein n=1 Tax=Candidatus Schekmanbacteria bacterium RBG_13_48_7 TaxID=1817878 RepID=A0A1F7RP77_9BACT|nr:MAG: SsrA-binding protein [Candidatus Schekmanbacteria bacterium RBG_13_48_7]